MRKGVSAMGILDSLENSPLFKGALAQLEGAVLPAVLSEVLGNGSQGGLNDVVKQLAARFNIPVDQLSQVLAQALPKAVDKASQNGTLPASS